MSSSEARKYQLQGLDAYYMLWMHEKCLPQIHACVRLGSQLVTIVQNVQEAEPCWRKYSISPRENLRLYSLGPFSVLFLLPEYRPYVISQLPALLPPLRLYKFSSGRPLLYFLGSSNNLFSIPSIKLITTSHYARLHCKNSWVPQSKVSFSSHPLLHPQPLSFIAFLIRHLPHTPFSPVQLFLSFQPLSFPLTYF